MIPIEPVGKWRLRLVYLAICKPEVTDRTVDFLKPLANLIP